MKKAWLVYSWDDNKDNDVDFVQQQLRNAGLDVSRDVYKLEAGRSIWDQIANVIDSDAHSDGLIFYATENSLASPKCREELSYAVTRALQKKGEAFPIIGLFPQQISNELIPLAIRSRLYVALSDESWIERVVSGIEQRTPHIQPPLIEPFYFKVHEGSFFRCRYAIEVRPRAGSWIPFYFGVLIGEKDLVVDGPVLGPRNSPPIDGIAKFGADEGESENRRFYIYTTQEEVTTTKSAYLLCHKIPSQISFGVLNSKTGFTLKIKPPRRRA